MVDQKLYSIFTEIIRRGRKNLQWIVKAKVICDSMFYESHAEGTTLEITETTAIERAKEIAKVK